MAETQRSGLFFGLPRKPQHKPTRASILALALLLALPGPGAQAHIVLQGVGSQSWFKLSPSSLELTFNMGFSAILGFEYLQRIDSNRDGRIDDLETRLFLEDLGPKLAKRLDLKIDGKDLDLKLTRSWATGLLGDVAKVEFDTFFVFRADLELGTKAHTLTWYEGNFLNEKSQQYAWLPATGDDYQSFSAQQKMPMSAPQQEREWIRHEGRDLSLDFSFKPEALVRAEARAKAQEQLEALESSLKAFENGVLRPSLENDLSLLAFEEARFGASAALPATPGPTAAIAVSREPGKEKVFESTANEQEELEELKWAVDQINQPFSWLAILVFMAMGAWHARTPGHGKTMVAAYLIGRKGTIKEAIKLGLMVTFTHTLSLYTMGLLAVYVVQRIYATEDYSANAFVAQATFWVKFVSGVMVFGFGLLLLKQRYEVWKSGGVLPENPAAHSSEEQKTSSHSHHHHGHHHHDHAHDHDHSHGHHHHHHHHHGHDHHGHDHHHHGELSEEEHSALHANELRDVHSFRDLLAVAISGGLVPCPMGILIIIYSLRPGSEPNNVLRCLSYLVSFSVGLGGVITALAITMVLFRERFARELEKRGRRGLLNFAPVFGAVVITVLGLALTYESFDANLKSLRSHILGAPTPPATGGNR